MKNREPILYRFGGQPRRTKVPRHDHGRPEDLRYEWPGLTASAKATVVRRIDAKAEDLRYECLPAELAQWRCSRVTRKERIFR